MRDLIKCRGCGKEFWAKQIKVYVFKERTCSNCKSTMVRSPDTGNWICPVCGLTVDPKTPEGYIKFGLLGVVMKGTSRNILEAEKMRQKLTMEVEKIFVNKSELCQQCKNFLSHRTNLLKRQERKGKMESVKDLTKKEIDDLGRQKITQEEINAIREDVRKRINADYAAKQRAEEEAKKKQTANETAKKK